MIVEEGGLLRAGRQVSIASDRGIDCALLLSEAERCVGSHEKGCAFERVSQVFFAGESELATRLVEDFRAIRSATGEREVGDAVLPFEIGIEYLQEDSETNNISPVSALCAAGACSQYVIRGEFNLLPDAWGQKRQQRRRVSEIAKTVGLALSVCVLLYVYLAVCTYRLESRCEAIRRRIEPIRDVASQLEVKKRQNQMIHSQLSGRSLPLQLLAELYQRVPDGVHLSLLTMDLNAASPELTMRGPAGSLEAAFAFPMVLEESPLFVDVRPDAAQQVSRGKGVLIEFGCRCRVDRAASVSGR